MPQLDLLSILSNTVAGLTLAGDSLGEKFSFLAPFKNLRENRTAAIIISAAAITVGVLKLIIPSPRETVPVVEDLLPALAGIIVGGILLAESFRQKVEAAGQGMERLSRDVLSYRVPAGIMAVVIALVHFLFPGAVIL
jgi:hypothetical protein